MNTKNFLVILAFVYSIIFYSCESNDNPANNYVPYVNTPNLLSPGNNSTISTLQPLFDWSDVSSATSYRLQISGNSSFTEIILDTSGLSSSQYTSSSVFLTDSSSYYWRVRGMNATDTTDWSSEFSFSTLLESINATNKVLVELFTNTSCIPCVDANRYLDDVNDLSGITSNDNSVIILRVHTTLFAGDPFYLYNTADNSARMNYYNAAAVNPRGFLIGTSLGSYTASSWTNKINEKLGSLRTFAIKLTNNYDTVSRNGNISFNVRQVSGQTVSDLVYHVAVSENEILYTAPNGETKFENTLRDLITPPDGQAFDISEGQTKSYSHNYSLAGIINQRKTDLIVFVQKISTKEIFAVEKIRIVQ